MILLFISNINILAGLICADVIDLHLCRARRRLRAVDFGTRLGRAN